MGKYILFYNFITEEDEILTQTEYTKKIDDGIVISHSDNVDYLYYILEQRDEN